MFAWASEQFDKITQTVAPPPTDAAGRFSFAVSRNDEATAMGCIAEMTDPTHTVVNQARGWFPIHMACQYSMVQLIRLLMNHPGVSIQQPDYSGSSPLHHACMSTQKTTALEVVKLLVNEYGADPCAKNSQGQTPYDVATLNSIRQYLLPIQLQRETQYALDNGGVGLTPGIDLGGLKISRPNMAPPPQFGGTGVVAAPPAAAGGSGSMMMMYPQTPAFGSPTERSSSAPSMYAASTPQQPPSQQSASTSTNASTNANASHAIAPAPVSMPGSTRKPGGEETSRYSRTGGSSLAVYSKYKADGFHSSSSDVNLQKKYGHVGATTSSGVDPPPDSGNAPLPFAGPNPFSGAANLGGVSRYASYGQTTTVAPAPVSGPVYGGMGYAPPAVGLAGQPAPKFFTPGATSASTPSATRTSSAPASAAAAEAAPTSPFLPPPPYSGISESATPAPTTSTTTSTTATNAPVAAAGDLASPFATPQPTTAAAASASATNLFGAPPATTAAETASTAAAAAAVASTEAAPAVGEPQSEEQPQPQSAEEDSSGDWVETTDPGSGATYYFNTKTNETSWEKPWETPAADSADAAMTETELATATESAAEPAEASDESDWTETVDPSSGSIYYYNSKTGETSWEKPDAAATESTDAVAANDETEPASQESQWVEATDPSSGNTYYYNSITGETSWDKPSVLQEEEEEEEDETKEKDEEPSSAPDADVDADAASPTDPAVEETEPVVAEDESSPAEETSESITTDPAEADADADDNADAVTTEIAEEKEPSEASQWAETTDPSTGNTYYYNSVTGETSWDKPAALLEEQQDEPPSAAIDAAVTEAAITDPVSEETEPLEDDGSPSETLPSEPPTEETSEDATDPSAADESTAEVTTEEEPTEASQWAETLDPSTGNTYYYNSVTGETSWEKPAALMAEQQQQKQQQPSAAAAIVEATDPVSEDTEPVAENQGAPVETFASEPPTEETSEPIATEPAAADDSGGGVATDEEPNQASEWAETTDPSTGDTYYYNSLTGETSWEKPAPLMEEEQEESSAVPDATTETETEPATADPISDETEAESSPEEISPDEPMAEESDNLADEKEATAEMEDETADDGAIPQENGDAAQEETTEDSGANDLPAGWSEVTDPSSGDVYYYNTETQVTSWDRPVAATDASGEANEEPVSVDSPQEECETQVATLAEETQAEPVDDLAEGWEEVQDPTSGNSYYVNKETQETSWEKPIKESSPSSTEDDQAPSSEEPQEADWAETLDPTSGETYYYNAKTGETSWEKPESLTTLTTQDSVPATTSETVDETTEPVAAEDTFAAPAVETAPKSGGSIGSLLNGTSPLAKSHERHQSAEEMFAAPAIDPAPKSGGSLADLLNASPLAKTHTRQKSAEDVFACPPTLDEPTTTSAAPTSNGGFVSEGAATTITIAQELFGVPSKPVVETGEEKKADVGSKQPVSSESADDWTEMDGEMTDIPLTPGPVMLTKSPSKKMSETTTEPAPAPTPSKGNDLFAAIGMPPPPFQSRR
eukprot:CAMPEP_0172385446 /NCGR_PEP_ID=MMETSP1061-20121228/3118_1 /TAXON_ID=37318 /ORGANISM="Pseudo-nitzschia pungens, Strain cf. pungens" /LENGTH=1522 /DNA_ID=CAMNT_0013114481 /DNA_START=89 /DNA_END=4660 /DNA_ORIENTATION=+